MEPPPTNDSPHRIALIGPSASGKTQFRLFFVFDHSAPPRYLRSLYGIMSQRAVTVPSGDDAVEVHQNALRPIEFDGAGIPYQQLCRGSKKITTLQVEYEDEAKRRRADVWIDDFPGESFTLRYKKTDQEWKAEEAEANELFSRLRQARDIVFVVPFWHLLPEAPFKAILEANAEVGLSADLGLQNRQMSDDIEYGWLPRLESLRLDRSVRRRITIALSQLGGRTLDRCRNVLKDADAGRSGRGEGAWLAVPALEAMVESADRLAAFDGDERPGLAAVPEALAAIAELRRFQRRCARFVATCARGNSITAKGLRDVTRRWHPEFVAFNVIDGSVTERSFEANGQPVAAQVFRQEPRNVHLTLLKFWQQATLDWVW